MTRSELLHTSLLIGCNLIGGPWFTVKGKLEIHFNIFSDIFQKKILLKLCDSFVKINVEKETTKHKLTLTS